MLASTVPAQQDLSLATTPVQVPDPSTLMMSQEGPVQPLSHTHSPVEALQAPLTMPTLLQSALLVQGQGTPVLQFSAAGGGTTPAQ